jgi:anti-anti-sigma factor
VSALVTTSTGADEGSWLVSLHGDHDLASRPTLARETNPIWARCKIAIIDLSDATFLDSGVIRWLLDVERQLEEAGAFTLSIVEGPAGSVAARLFELLGMRHVLACYPTLEDALAQSPPGWGSLVRPPPQRQRCASRSVA